MKKPTIEEPKDPTADFLRDVGKRVQLIRESKGISRRAMTEGANLKPAYGMMIELEGQNFTIKSLNNIARALGCDPRDLMPLPTIDPGSGGIADLVSDNRLLVDLIQRQQEQIEELLKTSQLIKAALA